jgi:amidophosphoribosyltransferase
MLFDGLTVLQHRGQDAAGIVTAERRRLHLRKDNGLVKDVFQQHHMIELRGNMGIGHCRYPTAGTSSCAEAQPLYTNYPYGICLAHNGNLTNSEELTQFLAGRHVNTDSDSELLLNLFANHLSTTVAEKEKETADKNVSNGNGHHPTITLFNDDSDQGSKDMQDVIFSSIATVMQQCEGGYAGMYLINGVGLVGFRDPHGIRPLVFGCRQSKSAGQAQEKFDADGIPHTPSGMDTVEKMLDYVISSESVAIDTLGFQLVRYVLVCCVLCCVLCVLCIVL